MTALNLLRRCSVSRVILCERTPPFSRGAAYGTTDPVHLLNVRAANMSAFVDAPTHFADWLEGVRAECPDHVHETPAGAFVSRAVYGRYLSALLRELLAQPDCASRLQIVPEEAVRVQPDDGAGFRVHRAGGRVDRVQGVVLAVGNLASGRVGAPGRYVPDPWSVDYAADLEAGRPVAVIGTGLTMVDIVMRLQSSGFEGPLLAVSRQGLLPHTHAPVAAPWPSRTAEEWTALKLSDKLALLRSDVAAASEAGSGWHAVIDGLRPITSQVWCGMERPEQARFLRHLRRWWDVHRHRMAPTVAARLQAMRDTGYLSIAAGRVEAIEPGEHDVSLRWRPRGESSLRNDKLQRVISAMGGAPVGSAKNALLDQMLADGLAKPDAHGIGIDVTDEFEVIGRDGAPVRGLWALGPLVRGRFWECTAVPDIRRDARSLAQTIAAGGPSMFG
jgi:uncharacterized NAD(P)/FAD-binding protein YdhS